MYNKMSEGTELFICDNILHNFHPMEKIAVCTLLYPSVDSVNGRIAVSFIYYWSRKVNYLRYYMFIKRVMYHRGWSWQQPYIPNIYNLKVSLPHT